jgi:transcriptional regulator with XRE-family HTH domain
MFLKTNGNIIAELRREAGYTQKMLAEALNITDKAISKWERGISMPDVSLLPKLSNLLDADIELLLQEESSCLHKEWLGLIDLRNFNCDMAQIVYDKPMVYYVLAHYLLLGIRDIYLLGYDERQSWLTWDRWNQIGVRFVCNFDGLPKKNFMIMQRPCFLFGSDLTRRFQAAMSTGQVTKLCPEWDISPFLFCPMEYA